jgi:prefoldin subunit 5
MALSLEQIDKRLAEIPQQIMKLTAEQNQLAGYKQALEDVEAEATPKNGEVIPPPQKEKKSKVGKGV